MSGLAERTSTSRIIRQRSQRIVNSLGLLVLLLLGLGWAFFQVKSYENGLVRREFTITGQGAPPVSTLEIAVDNAADNTPVLIVAHGFSANKETMQAIGVETALRLGVRVLLLDFPGHGQSPTRFPTSFNTGDDLASNIMPSLEAVYNYARGKYPTAPVALLGHSMGTGIVARFARTQPQVSAVILISPASLPELSRDNPPNLLMLVGENDISASLENARTGYQQATGQPADLKFSTAARSPSGEETGSVKNGDARRLRVLPGQNHITILYSPDTLAEINGWLGRVFLDTDGKAVQAAVLNSANGAGVRFFWMVIGLFLAVATIFPAASLLTDTFNLRAILSASPRDVKFSTSLLHLLVLLVAEAIAALIWTPFKPPQFTGLQLGSYLGGFFLISGGLALLWLWWSQYNQITLVRPDNFSWNWGSVISTRLVAWVLVPAILAALTYVTLGIFSAQTWESLQFSPGRILPFILMLVCLTPYFLADEYIFRQMHSLAGYLLGILSKVGLLIVLAVAAMLNPGQLSFLVIVLPVLAILFVVFGLFSVWQYRQGRDFVTTAALQTLLFAWIISCFFPLV